MSEDRIFALVAMLCLLLWLLGRNNMVGPVWSPRLTQAAYLVLGLGIAVAVLASLGTLLG